MPLSRTRDAPKFMDDPRGFDEFFDNVAELAARAKLDDAAEITWAIRYAGEESECWENVPCRTKGPDATPATLDEFKEEVRQRYPHLLNNRRYSIVDLTKLLERTQDYRAMSQDDLGIYYRRFLSIADYLIKEDRLSERERNAFYLKGFPQPIRASIKKRLEIKCPDVRPADGYKLSDIHDAASFAVDSQDPDIVVAVEPQVVVQPAPARDSMEELIRLMTTFTKTIASQHQQPPPSHVPQQFPRSEGSYPTPGGVAQNPPPWNPQPRAQDAFAPGCMFCSAPDHYLRECPLVTQYIQQRKIMRNEAGKLTLLDGRFVPRNVPGRNMRERFDNYLAWRQRNPEGNQHQSVATNFFESNEEYAFEVEVTPDEPDTQNERIELLQAQINSLREAQVLAQQKQRERFDGVEVPPRKIGFPQRPAPAPAPPPPPPPPPAPLPPNIHSQRVPPQSFPNRDPPPHLAGKPGAPVNPPARPQGPMKPLEMQPKPSTDEQKHQYHAPIEKSVPISEVIERALDAKVPVSARELLAVSNDARKHIKDLVTAKRVAANFVAEDLTDSFLTSFTGSESSSVSLDVNKYESTTISAAPSLPLRVIYPSFASGVEPECILDSGAQIVVMRRDIWEKLRVPITANKAMSMESANSGTTLTLGMVEHQPVTLGPITIYLQIQVVDNAPFEVLLGRPFFDVLSCMDVSHSGGTHEIHVKDPKTGTPYVFPTQPRQPKASRGSAVNFRL